MSDMNPQEWYDSKEEQRIRQELEEEAQRQKNYSKEDEERIKEEIDNKPEKDKK
jgi:hypothetical protein